MALNMQCERSGLCRAAKLGDAGSVGSRQRTSQMKFVEIARFTESGQS